MTDNLSRDEIDRVVAAVTMGDVQAALEAGVPERAMGGVAFRRAATRIGLTNGKGDPLDRVAFGDVRYLGERMSETLSDTSPKSESIAD